MKAIVVNGPNKAYRFDSDTPISKIDDGQSISVLDIGGGSGGAGGGFSPPNFWKILLTDRFLPAEIHKKVDWAPPQIDKVTWAPSNRKIIPPPLVLDVFVAQ